jgi:hypothetical protein
MPSQATWVRPRASASTSARKNTPRSSWPEFARHGSKQRPTKLLGHAEECLGLGARRGLVALTPAQQEERRTAVRRVGHILDELERRRLEEPKALDRELFRQLIGDTCHVRHGLTLV